MSAIKCLPHVVSGVKGGFKHWQCLSVCLSPLHLLRYCRLSFRRIPVTEVCGLFSYGCWSAGFLMHWRICIYIVTSAAKFVPQVFQSFYSLLRRWLGQVPRQHMHGSGAVIGRWTTSEPWSQVSHIVSELVSSTMTSCWTECQGPRLHRLKLWWSPLIIT